jgi:hypothetical protein
MVSFTLSRFSEAMLVVPAIRLGEDDEFGFVVVLMVCNKHVDVMHLGQGRYTQLAMMISQSFTRHSTRIRCARFLFT